MLEEYLKDIAEEEKTDTDRSGRSVGSAFSPYAKVGGDNGRSVCLLEQTGEVVEQDGTYYVEGYVREARGGEETFRRYNHDGFVMLSKKDAEKWDFEEGAVVVIIGGQSRNSRLLDLTDDETVAEVVEATLREEGRDAALDALDLFEYDVGEAGHNGPRRERTEPSDAARIKREIDNGQREPEYMDILRVSCRLLRLYGWERTWAWIGQTFGDEFDPDETHEKLTAIVDCYFEEIDPPRKTKYHP